MAGETRNEAEPRKERRDVPMYLARYRERAVERSARPETHGTSFYLRRFYTRSAADTSRSEEVGPSSGDGDSSPLIEVHLVRHGQTQGYTVDGRLTPLGAWQARRRGHELSKAIDAGETVILAAAETTRTIRTAEFMRSGIEDGLALREKDAEVVGPECIEELHNFRVRCPSGLKDVTQAFREYQVQSERHERLRTEPRPMWLVEMDRFWQAQQDGGDPIAYWMTSPLVHFEPPAIAVHRFWAGLVRLAETWGSASRIVCSVNSGPMRAFATSALGCDLGEPRSTEEVRVRLQSTLREARVTYRDHTRDVEVPSITGYPDWDGF